MTQIFKRGTRMGCTRGRSHVWRGTALAALCALALTACGAERAGDGDRIEAGRGDAEPGAAEPGDSGFLAFMELLLSVAEPCQADLPSQAPPVEPTPTAPPTAPLPELTLPAEPPPTGEPRTDETAKGKVELDSVEKCEAPLHARRITKALNRMPDPTPSRVREALRGLGYIDERIHGPQRSGKTVEFILDLRVMGGQLCLSGSVSGARTAIEPYGASPEVGCPDVRRRG
ncbi:hypothetical protein [Streptomyces sp. NPDC057580]|uniref:hypothetical protein n=1 Tax=Streptomyces sp. NPDC057580 TaxID=3346173 RepID=UPI003691F4E7